MLINPQHVIENKWITGIHDIDKQIQPNAIDFTLDRVHKIRSAPFYLYTDENGVERKEMRGTDEIFPHVRGKRLQYQHNVRDFFSLDSTSSFDGTSDVYVNIPEGVAAMMVIRSTLNRNGIYLVSGLYDSGYQGHVGFVLYNLSRGTAYLQKGSRVGQIMFFPSENAKLYAGGWNHPPGTHYSDSHERDLPNTT